MWIGKIGKKSAAFINHKPFHPGNFQNQEKVWLAEQKLKEEQRKEKELEERRKEEAKIEELRRVLRGEASAAAALSGQPYQQQSPLTAAEELRLKAKKAERQQQLQRQHQEALQRLKELAKSSLYTEDVFVNGHTSVYGSLYNKETQKWAYRCCGCTDRNAQCPENPHADKQGNRKRKHKSTIKQEEGRETETKRHTQANESEQGASADKNSSKEPNSRSPPSQCKPSGKQEDLDKDTKTDSFLGNGSKRKVREGGVAAYLRLLEVTQEET